MNKIYAIRLKDGEWTRGSYWESTPDITKAKIYPRLSNAKAALTRNRNFGGWENAELVTIEVYPGGDEEVETLRKFYQAETLIGIIKAQMHHVEKLQDKLITSQGAYSQSSIVRAR